MELNQFARIGKYILMAIIGIQDKARKSNCAYQLTLKINALKLFLLYHFLQPDAQGFVKDVDVRLLAEKVGCTVATIYASNKVLETLNYCYISNSGLYDHHISVYLPEYRNYHKTAAEGGRGYVTMSSEMLMDLLGISSLNTLRLTIKGILEVDNASYAQAQDDACPAVEATYDKLRISLPSYCKRNVIRKSLEQSDSIFDMSFSAKGVSFTIHEKYERKNMRSAMKGHARENIIHFVENINDVIEAMQDATDPAEKGRLAEILSAMHIEKSGSYPFLSLRLTDYEDLVALALQYNLHIVHTAVIHIYNKYIAANHPIEKFGALARTIIRNMSFSKSAS